MVYVYSTPNGAGRAMSYEELPNPWPMLCVAVFDDAHCRLLDFSFLRGCDEQGC